MLGGGKKQVWPFRIQSKSSLDSYMNARYTHESAVLVLEMCENLRTRDGEKKEWERDRKELV